MNKNTGKSMILVAVIAIVLIGALFFLMSGSQSTGPVPALDVTLSATLNKDTFTADEDINVSLELLNAGERAVCLSSLVGGNVVFNTVQRDGGAVETRTTNADYIEALPILLMTNLEPVASGKSLTLALESEHDPGLGSRALGTTVVDGNDGILTLYDVGQPGQYTIELAYHYAGLVSDECTAVFEGPSNTATITFTVTE